MPSRTSAPPDRRWLRVTIVTAFLALSVVMPSRVCSQQPTDSAQRVRPSLDTAALIVQRRTVAVFRSPLGALSPADRASEVTLPNAIVVGASVKNFSRGGGASDLLLYTSVTIGYDTPWRQVEGMLIDAAKRTGGLGYDPAPFVLKTALSDFYVEYQLNAIATNPADRVRVLDRLHANILDSFNEYGVQIMSPHYMRDPPQPAVVPRERWYEAPAVGE